VIKLLYHWKKYEKKVILTSFQILPLPGVFFLFFYIPLVSSWSHIPYKSPCTLKLKKREMKRGTRKTKEKKEAMFADDDDDC